MSRLGSDARLAVQGNIAIQSIASYCRFCCSTMPTVMFMLPFSSSRLLDVAEICGVGHQLSHGRTRSSLSAVLLSALSYVPSHFQST